MTKEDLENEGYENVVVFDNPDFGDSIIGVDINNRAVYSLEKMISNLMDADNMKYEDAFDFISYNTARSLPYLKGAPIIVEMFVERKKYAIIAVRERLDNYLEKYYVSYDNIVANSPNDYMTFWTENEAKDWTLSDEAKEWKDCRFDIVEI